MSGDLRERGRRQPARRERRQARMAERVKRQAPARVLEPRRGLRRLKRAQLEAKSYTPYRGAHRDLIVQLLLDAAEERWGTDPPGRRYFFANWGRRAVWAEPEALGELDPCRVRTRWPMLVEGAQCLARFGAFSCIACGMAFSESGRYERGVGKRSSRSYHCGRTPQSDP